YHRDLHAPADVLTAPGADRGAGPPAHHQGHAATGQVRQHRLVLGDLERTVRGEQRGGGRQDDLLGPGADVSDRGGLGGGRERRVVVLTEREHVQAHLLGELGLLGDRAQALLLAGDPARGGIGGDVGDAEDSELHGGVLLGWGVAGTARR